MIFFSAFERMVAWRYLFARCQERFVSVVALFSFLGILLGVATLIVVMSVMNGFRHELLGRILGFNGHITLYNPPQHSWDSPTSLQKKIQDIPGVISVTPLVERQVMVMGGGGVRGAVARGMAISDLKIRLILSQNIRDGSLDLQSNEIVIGAKLAQRLGLSVGSEISLMAPEGTVTAIGTVPRVRKFKVGAVFDMGMSEYDSVYIFLVIETAQQFFRMGSEVSGLEIFVQNPHQVHEQEAEIPKCLGSMSAHIVNWQKANANFFGAIQVERNVMFLILTLIIVIAAFNVISGMLMLVKEKTSDIAILRTIGAGTGMVMRIFFLVGASIGIAGTSTGVLLGLGFAYNIEKIKNFLEYFSNGDLFQSEIYFLSRLPSRVEWSDILTIACLTLGCTFLATLYPAWRAARLNPVQALRYE